jgi:two-component system response regulator FixJ
MDWNRAFVRSPGLTTKAGGEALGACVKHLNHNVIVVVEDDAGMRDSLEFLLESHGFEVAAFATSADMLGQLAKLKTGCAILDIHLPGPDGIAIYERLAAQGRNPPAIFITGQVDDRIRADARRLKAVALLEKPFTDEALLDAVDRALSAARA